MLEQQLLTFSAFFTTTLLRKWAVLCILVTLMVISSSTCAADWISMPILLKTC